MRVPDLKGIYGSIAQASILEKMVLGIWSMTITFVERLHLDIQVSGF
jgi:hypothetical protein